MQRSLSFDNQWEQTVNDINHLVHVHVSEQGKVDGYKGNYSLHLFFFLVTLCTFVYVFTMVLLVLCISLYTHMHTHTYTGCSRKNCTKFMHHNFATVRHRVTQFSAKCSERNCLHDRGQCLNMAIQTKFALSPLSRIEINGAQCVDCKSE